MEKIIFIFLKSFFESKLFFKIVEIMYVVILLILTYGFDTLKTFRIFFTIAFLHYETRLAKLPCYTFLQMTGIMLNYLGCTHKWSYVSLTKNILLNILTMYAICEQNKLVYLFDMVLQSCVKCKCEYKIY